MLENELELSVIIKYKGQIIGEDTTSFPEISMGYSNERVYQMAHLLGTIVPTAIRRACSVYDYSKKEEDNLPSN